MRTMELWRDAGLGDAALLKLYALVPVLPSAGRTRGCCGSLRTLAAGL